MNDGIPIDVTRDYVIPGRAIRNLMQAMGGTPQPTDMELLMKFLDATGIDYDYEDYSCGDSSMSQVWFHPPHGWELVFTFDRETGKYREMYLEA